MPSNYSQSYSSDAVRDDMDSGAGHFFAELFNAAIGLVLSYDSDARRELIRYAGTVIKIKCHDPKLLFFVCIDDEGVSVMPATDAAVTARVVLSTSTLARYLIGIGDTDSQSVGSIKTFGDEALLAELALVAQRFSLLQVCKQLISTWLPDFDSVDDLLAVMRSGDADWLQRLEFLPQLVSQNMEMTRKQTELIDQQANELKKIRHYLEYERKLSKYVSIAVGLVILLSFCAHNDVLPLPFLRGLSLDSTVLVGVAAVLLLPKLLKPHRD